MAETHTVIIGAGAAGLAAAYELSCANHDVIIVEASERLGGRIHTDTTTHAAVPIELGAEFIHGASPAVMGWLERTDQLAIDVSGDRWRVRDGKLRTGDGAFGDLKHFLGRLSRPRHDLPFAEFLQRHRRSLPSSVRELARMLVEGFDAADASRISTLEVLDEWSGETAADAPTFRPARGYGALVDGIRDSLKTDRATLRLGTVVREIAWRKGRVVVEADCHGKPIRIEAARAIVTLPLGVLQLPPTSPSAVHFTPGLRSKRIALARLAAGPVVKVVMNFARPFWTELHDGRYRDAGFLFAPQATFPTFWTSLPARSSVLVAWAAGPNAARLTGKNADQILADILESLRRLFGRRRNYFAQLESACWHDWQGDPFACGAYSYVVANGATARRALAQPLQETLYFAGEACDTKGEAGTVGGALQSGTRAARQVLESNASSNRRRARKRR